MSSLVVFFSPFEESIVSFSNSFDYFLVKICFAVFVNGCTSLLLWSIFLECLFSHPLPWSNAYSWCWAILFEYNRRIDYVLASILFACVILLVNWGHCYQYQWGVMANSLYVVIVFAAGGRVEVCVCVCVCVCAFPFLQLIQHYLLFIITYYLLSLFSYVSLTSLGWILPSLFFLFKSFFLIR